MLAILKAEQISEEAKGLTISNQTVEEYFRGQYDESKKGLEPEDDATKTYFC